MDLVVRHARIAETGPLVDIGCSGGTITAVGSALGEPSAATVLDADGRVVLPGLVEPHIHLDKALLAGRTINRSGTLAEAIQVTGAAKASFSRADIFCAPRQRYGCVYSTGQRCSVPRRNWIQSWA